MQVENLRKMDGSLFGEGLTLLSNRCARQIMLHVFYYYFLCRLINSDKGSTVGRWKGKGI